MRILSIEDDAAIRQVIVATLGAEGHEVLEAPDGAEGLRMAAECAPDLILLDFGLPEVHGTRVLDKLKKDPDLSRVPIIVVSAWGEPVTAEMAKEHGASDVIRKPFDLDDLRMRVEDVLGCGQQPIISIAPRS